MEITFKPKQAVKQLLVVLPDRAREVVIARYGLGTSPEKMTLEAIGEQYNITRERVRQIEGAVIAGIRKADAFKNTEQVFGELSLAIDGMGGVVPEEDLLDALAKDHLSKNHIYFLLVLGNPFKQKKEDLEFRRRWYIDEAHADTVHSALQKLYASLSDDDLIPESDLIDRFLSGLKDINQKYRNEEIARRWLALSKNIAANPLGEWGVAHSTNVRAKGVRDYAYLAIKRHGSPMHFSEVAQTITDLFKRKAHVATCHNELIKDSRFVLVGRGLYALKEWGYSKGVVKDVIREMLEKNGPLSREEIIELVQKERYVKANTIVVNLQNTQTFKRGADGGYTLL